MAARVHPEHDARTRAKIQTSQLVNRLNAIGMGEADCSPTQMKAIEILLRKSLPDLTSVALTGGEGGPVQITVSTGVPRGD
jgi:hypothetical protein